MSAKAGAGRWSAKRKVSVILELLRGADLESTSRKYRVTAASLDRLARSFSDQRRGRVEDPGDGRRRRGATATEISGRHRERRERIIA